MRHGQRTTLSAETDQRSDRHQEIISIMAERKVSDNRNSIGTKEFVQQRVQLGLVSAAFQLPYQQTSDASKSTRQPEVGQHAVDAIQRLVNVFPEPSSVVDPEALRRPGERRRQREAPSEEHAIGVPLSDHNLRIQGMRA